MQFLIIVSSFEEQSNSSLMFLNRNIKKESNKNFILTNCPISDSTTATTSLLEVHRSREDRIEVEMIDQNRTSMDALDCC